MKALKLLLIALLLGFACMFAAHIIVLLGFGAGIQFPIYPVAYLIVYPLFAYLVTKGAPQFWALHATGLCVVPLVYWFWLLWDMDRLGLPAFQWKDVSVMLLVMPLTLLVCLVVAYATYRSKKWQYVK